MEEYISKEEIIDECRRYANHEYNVQFKPDVSKDRKHDSEVAMFMCEHFRKFVKELPSADVRPNIHGHWGRLTRVENVYSIDGVKTWGIKCQCDKCTFTTIVVEGFGFYDYCPRCGSRNEVEADMREPIGEKGK